jgi:hypothetical protein
VQTSASMSTAGAPRPGRSRQVAATVATALAALSAAAGLSACSSGSASSGDLAAVDLAYTHTVAAKTAQLTMKMHVSAAHTNTTIIASGGEDFATHDAAFTVDATGASIKELMVAGKVYLQLPPAAQSQEGGKAWLEVAIPTTAGASGSSPLVGSDPASGLHLLERHSTSITKVGTAVIDGVDTTEYHAVVDVAGAANQGDSGLIGQYIEITGSSTLPVDVWIDSQQRVVQEGFNITVDHLPSSASTAQGSQSLANELPVTVGMQLNVTRYGQPVTVTAPPASEVKQISLDQLNGSVSSS